jgi:hypothetical protein
MAHTDQSDRTGTASISTCLPSIPAVDSRSTRIAIDPTFTMQRMLVQHSHFTVHGRDLRGLEAMRAQLSLQDDLVRVTIDADQREVEFLQLQLTFLGITETTIFPDLEGLARELRLEYHLDTNRLTAI